MLPHSSLRLVLRYNTNQNLRWMHIPTDGQMHGQTGGQTVKIKCQTRIIPFTSDMRTPHDPAETLADILQRKCIT